MGKKGVSKGVIFSVFVIIILVIAVICGAFYIHNNTPKEVEEKNLSGGKISLTYAEEENLFVIENAIPTSDLSGKMFDSADLYFDFTVGTEIEEANYVEYEVILVKDENVSTILDENIKVYLEKEEKGVYTEAFGPELFENDVNDSMIGNYAMKLYSQKKTTSGNDNYRLRIWLSDTAVYSTEEVQNYGVKIAIKGVAK